MDIQYLPKVLLFTDGSCTPNPGIGGYAALLQYEYNHKIHEKEITGCEKETTNNRMELMAVIHGLKALKHPTQVTIYTDSQYVQKGITVWMEAWKKRNFKKVQNVDLWKILNNCIQSHHIQWEWVKAHNGHPENERVDKLAKEAAQQSMILKESDESIEQN